ncbi:hypothetical protein N5F00_20050, partial [Pseudomonas chengduensis]
CGKQRGRSRSCKRVGGAARTADDADMPLRMAHPTVDPLTLREQSSLLQVISTRLRFKYLLAMVVLF